MTFDLYAEVEKAKFDDFCENNEEKLIIDFLEYSQDEFEEFCLKEYQKEN